MCRARDGLLAQLPREGAQSYRLLGHGGCRWQHRWRQQQHPGLLPYALFDVYTQCSRKRTRESVLHCIKDVYRFWCLDISMGRLETGAAPAAFFSVPP